MSNFGMIMDTRRCIGCQACTVACKSENKVPLGVFRTHVKIIESGTYPKTKKRYAQMICMQCKKPPCVDSCPVDATFKNDDGIVLIDYNKCIGCGYCLDACPYDARFLNPEDVKNESGGEEEWGANRPIGKADKCTFCAHRLAKGLVPSCVNTCVGGARQFGDFDDNTSDVAKLRNEVLEGSKALVNVKGDYGPEEVGGLAVFYILSADADDYNLPELGDVDIKKGKQLVKVVGSIAGAATIGYLGLSFVSSSIQGDKNG